MSQIIADVLTRTVVFFAEWTLSSTRRYHVDSTRIDGRYRRPSASSADKHMPDIECDVLVVGASLGGVAAAIRAAAMGSSVVLIEESQWVGGQLTAQGVCTPDENRWIE